MNRSPLFYPLNRGMDADAGGAADLQTDVMRFMAILSLCLVAIFALVQSIPLAPPVEHTPAVSEVAPSPAIEPTPQAVIPAAPGTVSLVRPQLQRLPEPAPQPQLKRPKPAVGVPAPQPEASAPSPAPAVTPPPARRGFTLRFDDDAALTSLVERGSVGLYAMSGKQSFRMQVAGGRFSFWPASLPEQFHEMHASTVPASVLAAFARGSAADAGTMQWGVTIPPSTRRQVDRYLHDTKGGTLIIDADGALRLEP